MKFKVLNEIPQPGKKELHKPSIPSFQHFPTGLDIEFLCVDTEGTGLRWAKDHWSYGISLAWICPFTGKYKTAWYDFPVDPFTWKPDYCGQKGLNVLNSYLLDPHVDIVFANAKYDMHMLEKILHTKPVGVVHDVILAAWACNTLEKSYKLDNLADKYVGISKNVSTELRKETERASKEFKKINPRIMDVHIMQRCWILKYLDHGNRTLEKYGRMDALRTLKLHLFYQDGLFQLDVEDTYYKELEVMRKLYAMEKRGVRANKATIDSQATTLTASVRATEQTIYNQLGQEINLNSWQQKARVFYHWDKETGDLPRTTYTDKFPLPVMQFSDGKTNGKPNPSVATPVLAEFKHIPVINSLMQYQGYCKGLQFYENYQVHIHDDRVLTCNDMLPGFEYAQVINPTFNQMASVGESDKGTRTGRLSASDPNLTNVADPKKSSGYFVQDARAVFEPRPGYVFLFIDYSQVELRIFAERCGGQLKNAFLTGRDPHNETRTSVPCLAAMEHDRGRKLAKNTNFTVVNCGGANVLLKKYGIPLEQGKQIFNELHSSFPEIRKRQNAAQKYAEEHGYIETLFGRRIHVDRERKNGKFIWTYKATSFDIQGSASDVIKRAIIETSNFLEEERSHSRLPEDRREGHLLLAIHDELVFEIKREHFKRSFVKELVRIMENVAKGVMSIPLECSAEYSTKSWSSNDKKELKL